MSKCRKGESLAGNFHVAQKPFHLLMGPHGGNKVGKCPRIPAQGGWGVLHANEWNHILKRKDVDEPIRQSVTIAKPACDK